MLVGEAKAHFSAALTQQGEAMAAGQDCTQRLSGAIASVQESLSNVLAVAAVDVSPTIGHVVARLNEAEAKYRAAQEAIEEAQQAIIIAQEQTNLMIRVWSV